METSVHVELFSSLVRRFAGVQINNISDLPDRLIVRLQITDVKSVVRFKYFLCAANVRCAPYADNPPEENESDAEALSRMVWPFCFRKKSNKSELFDDFHGFCAFMLWDLDRRGKISDAEASVLFKTAKVVRHKRTHPS